MLSLSRSLRAVPRTLCWHLPRAPFALAALSSLALCAPPLFAQAPRRARASKSSASAPAEELAAQPPLATAISPAESASLAAPSTLAAQSPSAAPLPPDELRQLVRRYGNARPSHFFDVTTDGAQLLFGTRFGESEQLHLLEAPLGMRRQLTFFDEPVTAARFLPQDPNTIFFLRDPSGGDAPQLFQLDRTRARIVQLTKGPGRQGDLLLARDGRRLAWSTTAPDGETSNLFVAEAETPGASRKLTREPGRYHPVDFAPHAHALLVIQTRAPGDDALFLAPVDGGAWTKLFPQGGKASVRAARFSADGRDLFVVTDRFSDAEELWRLDPDHPDAPGRPLTAALKWDVDALAVAEDRGAPATAAITVDQGGYDRLYLLEPGTLSLMPVPLPPGVVTALRFPTVRADVLFVGLESPMHPNDLYQLDVRTRRLTRWTKGELGPLDESQLLQPARVSWTSDGLPISALLYRPANELGKKTPVVIALHRGSLERPRYDALAQALANELGIAVLSPSLRGSRDAGRALLGDADPKKLEQEQLADLSSALDWIAKQPDLDAARVALLSDVGVVPPEVVSKLEPRLQATLERSPRSPGPSGHTLSKSETDRELESLLDQLRQKLLGYPATASEKPRETSR